MISDWLTERLDCSLHPYQLACLLNITRVPAASNLSYFDFSPSFVVGIPALSLIEFTADHTVFT